MKLKAIRALRYGGKSVLKGGVFEVLPRDERVLVAAKIAAPYVEPPPVVRAPVTKTIVRAMAPESAEVSTVSNEPTVEAAKRTYKRRDMTAE
jgi:hypothetical protein